MQQRRFHRRESARRAARFLVALRTRFHRRESTRRSAQFPDDFRLPDSIAVTLRGEPRGYRWLSPAASIAVNLVLATPRSSPYGVYINSFEFTSARQNAD